MKLVFLAAIVAMLTITATNISLVKADTGSDNNPCSGNPHDRDSGSSGNPHDNGENGNPHDTQFRHHNEIDNCPGSK